jgi:2-aminobenzoate-CoA ligase
MIVSSGYNISGQEIEEVLLEHPNIRECAVVGVPDSARGQIVKAFVVLRDNSQGGEDLSPEIQDFVKKSIAPYKYPRAVEFVREAPTNDRRQSRQPAARIAQAARSAFL